MHGFEFICLLKDWLENDSQARAHISFWIDPGFFRITIQTNPVAPDTISCSGLYPRNPAMKLLMTNEAKNRK